MAQIAQLIKYEGDNNTFVWKSPIEDFNTGTQLIVHDSQEAVFFMNGQALDLFGGGVHTLETQNLPFLNRLLNLPTGGQTPFHCEVYFVNKTDQPEIKWGTDSPIQFTEPTQNIALSLGASGTMILRAEDSRKLLVKLVGTEAYLGQTQLASKLRSIVVANVKAHLGQALRSGEVVITDVDSKILEISGALLEKLAPDFAAYGFTLVRFLVERWALPLDNERYQFLVNQNFQIAHARQQQTLGVINQQTEAQKIVIEAQALAAKRQLEGYTYQQEQSFEVSKLAAQNEGVGNFSAAGIGLGMMGGIAGGMGATMAGIMSNSVNPAMQQMQPQMQASGVPPMPGVPPQPQAGQPAAPQPGAAPADEMAALKQKIEKLKMMKESGLISDEEWEAERKKLLSAL